MIQVKKEYSPYYINWPRLTGHYIVNKIGQRGCIKICKTKAEAEQVIIKLKTK